MPSILLSPPSEAFPHPYWNRSTAHLNRFFEFTFVCLLVAEIFLSERPSEISLPLLFQVGILGIFLVFGLISILMKIDDLPQDRLIAIVLLFSGYFYTIGVLVSHFYGVGFRESIEYPYRISSLFMVLVIPFFVRREENLNRFFAMLLTMMALQIVRDLAVGAGHGGQSLILERLWGQEFSSVMFLGALPFAFGGLIAYWNAPRRRLLKRMLLLSLCAVVLLKLFLTYSRIVWLGIFPLNIIAAYYLIHRNRNATLEMRMLSRRIARLILLLALAGTITFSLMAVLTPGISKIIENRSLLTVQEAQARISEYHNAYKEWLTSPVWGKGFGYETRFYKSGRVREQEYVHNFALQFLMSAGIIGLAAITALLGTTAARLWRLINRSRSRIQTAALIASLVTLLNIVVMSSAQTIILKQDTYFLLAVVISLAVAVKRMQNDEFKRAIYVPFAADGNPKDPERINSSSLSFRPHIPVISTGGRNLKDPSHSFGMTRRGPVGSSE